MTVAKAPEPEKRPQDDRDRMWSALMAQAQTGDRNAYHELLIAILPYLRRRAGYALARSHDAEDVVQEILMTVHMARHTYGPKRPFTPWLATIAPPDRRPAARRGPRPTP